MAYKSLGGDRFAEEREQGYPTSPSVRDAILALQTALDRTYGPDYSFVVAGRGRILGQSALPGVVQPRI